METGIGRSTLYDDAAMLDFEVAEEQLVLSSVLLSFFR